jgi:hypothetical protein
MAQLYQPHLALLELHMYFLVAQPHHPKQHQTTHKLFGLRLLRDDLLSSNQKQIFR